MYVHIGGFDMKGAAATVLIGTTWTVAEDSDVTYLSGIGYQLQYKKSDGEWTVDKDLMM